MKLIAQWCVFVCVLVINVHAMDNKETNITFTNNLDLDIGISIEGAHTFKTAFSLPKKNGQTTNDPDKRKSYMFDRSSVYITNPTTYPDSHIPLPTGYKPKHKLFEEIQEDDSQSYENIPDVSLKPHAYENVPEVDISTLPKNIKKERPYENVPEVSVPREKKELIQEQRASLTINNQNISTAQLPEKSFMISPREFPLKITIYDNNQNTLLAKIQIFPDANKLILKEIALLALHSDQKSKKKQKLTIQLNYEGTKKTVTKHIIYDKDGNPPATFIKIQ
jgi:hypothetical protein